MATQTPNYSFQLPTPGGDNDLWGDYLNGNWSSIDTTLKIVSDTADAAQSTADTADGKADTNAADITTLGGRVTQNETDIASNTSELGEKIDKSGGTMTGPLILPSDPPAGDTEAAHKKYVDDTVAAAPSYGPIASADTDINGNVLAGSGLSCVRTGNAYVYTFDVAQANTNYHVSQQHYASNSSREFIRIAEKLTTGFTLNYGDFNGNGFPTAHSVIVFPIG